MPVVSVCCGKELDTPLNWGCCCHLLLTSLSVDSSFMFLGSFTFCIFVSLRDEEEEHASIMTYWLSFTCTIFCSVTWSGSDCNPEPDQEPSQPGR